MKKEFLFVLFYLSIQPVYTQSLPKILSTSPNAAILGKFGDVPVSQYTGSANISVPLYTVQSGEIIIPISLDYHTGGIRLKDLAGWTGLGWSLTASGVINRQLKDKDDLVGTNYFPELITKGQMQRTLPNGVTQTAPAAEFELGFVPSEFGTYLKVLKTTKAEQFDLSSVLQGLDSYDTEYDIFTYSVFGKSGKFIKTRSGQVILEKKDDIIVTLPSGGNEFRITDDRGFIYAFDSFEQASLDPYVGSYKTSWYLSKITSPRGDVVDFTYQTTTLPLLGQESTMEAMGCLGGESHTVSSTNFSQALILTRITFDNGYVDFPRDNNRTDYTGARVTGMKVFLNGSAIPVTEFEFRYSYFDTQRMRLDKVVQKNGTTELPPYQFTYITNAGFIGNTNLNSYDFDHWGYFNGRINTTILPKFQSGPLKTTAQGTILTILQYPFLALPGADREPDPEKMKVFSLKEVKYPTGGKTVLETEAHTYEYDLNEVSREMLPQCIYRDTILQFSTRGDIVGQLSWLSPYNASEVTAVIGFICTDPNNGCALYRNNATYPLGSIYLEFSGNSRDIAGDMVSCGGPQCQGTLTAPPFANVINFKSHIASNVGSEFVRINLHLTWYEKVYKPASNKKKYLYGGGLRIKKISDYDASGALIRSRMYDYHYKSDSNADGILEDHSNGKRMSPPSYWKSHMDSKHGDINGYCASFQRFSNSVIPLGASVTYDEVTEYSVDNLGIDQGKTIYRFENKQDSLYNYRITGDAQFNERPSGALNLSYKLNGSLLSKAEYKKITSGYQLLHEVQNQYSTVLLNNYFGLQHEEIQFDTETYLWVVFPIQLIYIYPTIRAERILQQKTIDKFYDTDDVNKFVLTEVISKYGNNHEQAIQVTKVSSASRTEIQKMVYPPDYGTLSSSTYGIKNLKDKNIITPIEQYTIVDGNVLSGSLTTYKQTLPFIDQVYILETSAPIALSNFTHSNKVVNTFSKDSRYVPRLNYEQYDVKGNIEVVSKSDDSKRVYLWGYSSKYPIAEVTNAAYADVAFTSFEANTNEGSWSFTSAPVNPPDALIPAVPTGKKCYSINSGPLTKLGLTNTITYVLTYWKKSGGIAVSAGSQVGSDEITTGANGWIFVKHFFTSATSINISGTGYIDDVRLYPLGAQMTTYAYDPLIGITSMTDANSVTITYEYDLFNRLKLVKDDKGKILKTYQYHYKEQKNAF